MPLYKFTCSHGHETIEFRSVAKYVEFIRCKHGNPSSRCGSKAHITICNNLLVNTFKPYVEHNLGKDPVLIENKQQRDTLCAKYGVTYDSAKYVRKKEEKAAVEDIEYADVKKTLETGRLPDGTPLELSTEPPTSD